MVSAPQTFNELLAEARAGGYRLRSLCEHEDGFFYCRWGHGETEGPRIQRRLPFNAMLDAWLECRSLVTEAAADRNEGDLFG